MEKFYDFLKGDWSKYGFVAVISAAFSALTTYNFTDREKSLAEMNAYEKFLTEVIVLNEIY